MNTAGLVGAVDWTAYVCSVLLRPKKGTNELGLATGGGVVSATTDIPATLVSAVLVSVTVSWMTEVNWIVTSAVIDSACWV